MCRQGQWLFSEVDCKSAHFIVNILYRCGSSLGIGIKFSCSNMLIFVVIKAVHDNVTTFEINLRKISLPLPAYIEMGEPMCPSHPYRPHVSTPQVGAPEDLDMQFKVNLRNVYWRLAIKGRRSVGLVRLLASLLNSFLGDLCSIPVFLHVGIVPDDAAGRQVFSGISRFPRPCILAFHTHLDVKSYPNISTSNTSFRVEEGVESSSPVTGGRRSDRATQIWYCPGETVDARITSAGSWKYLSVRVPVTMWEMVQWLEAETQWLENPIRVPQKLRAREPNSGAATGQELDHPIVGPHSVGREPNSGAAVAQWLENPVVGSQLVRARAPNSGAEAGQGLEHPIVRPELAAGQLVCYQVLVGGRRSDMSLASDAIMLACAAGVREVLVYATPVDDVGTLRNRIVAGFETIQEFPRYSTTHPGVHAMAGVVRYCEAPFTMQTNTAMAFLSDMIQSRRCGGKQPTFTLRGAPSLFRDPTEHTAEVKANVRGRGFVRDREDRPPRHAGSSSHEDIQIATAINETWLFGEQLTKSPTGILPPPPPVSSPQPEQARDRDSHESARATRRRQANTQLTSLSAGLPWHPTAECPQYRQAAQVAFGPFRKLSTRFVLRRTEEADIEKQEYGEDSSGIFFFNRKLAKRLVWICTGMKGQEKREIPRENQPTSSTAHHDSHMRKSGSDSAGN
ncbi:hypothetical protein PR048_002754 [Dryococelus australis]|uniref:Uncharacterized protein n=1 Tax=Dryococelus australis TaxID=614101 RepID=A0ABQ9IL38_9NEOP|nr:hypothetical protein PR048_002754 [Dryococelus australis]